MNTVLEEVGGQHHAPAALYPGKDPVPFVQEVGWAPRAGLPPTRIRSPHLPARSQSLYRLSYPVHKYWKDHLKFFQLDCYVPTKVPQSIVRGPARNRGKILKYLCTVESTKCLSKYKKSASIFFIMKEDTYTQTHTHTHTHILALY